jgi:hypothetical protein
MKIREYTPNDLEALRRLHAKQGFGYPFPDLESPLFVTKLVLEDEENGMRADDTEGADKDGADFGSRNLGGGREEAHVDSLRGPFVSSATAKPRRIAMAILLRLTAEAYLLHDPLAGSPRQRWQRFLALHEAARHSAAARGLDDVQAFLPPPVARAFGRRLARLGWRHDPWPCFSSRV